MRQSTLQVIGLAALCLAPIGFVVVGPNVNAISRTVRNAMAVTDRAPQATEAAKEASTKTDQAGDSKPGIGASVAALLQQAVAQIESPIEPVTHEPRLSIYTTPNACGADGQDSPMCRAAFRDARQQSERSSDIFDDLDACEHRYGEQACYERRLWTGFSVGENLYMPIMAGFAMVTDGQHMVARPVYRCPGRVGLGQDCHQTETGIVIRERENNRPVNLSQFEQDYTGYMLRQTVRETTVANGRAFVFVRTAVNVSPERSRGENRQR